MAIEFTLFTAKGSALTKSIRKGADGRPKTTTADLMSIGTADRVTIDSMRALAALQNGALAYNQAISTGVIRSDKPDSVIVTTVKGMDSSVRAGGDQDFIARSKKYLEFRRQPTLMLDDTDFAQAPPRVTEQFAAGCTPWNVLCAICPGLEGVGHTMRRSTSSGIIDRETGQQFPDSGGWHTYFAVQDGTDIKAFTGWLHDGCVMVGMGWGFVTACGAILRRSIVDVAVASPERLIFEAAPYVEPPLWQDPEKRRPMFVDGPAFDSRSRRVRSSQETADIAAAWAAEETLVAPRAAVVRAAWLETKATEIHTRTGKSMAYCRHAAEKWAEGELLPEVMLEFKDMGFVTVAEVWENPLRYHEEQLADPIEGSAYKSGLTCAKLFVTKDGVPWINSFAHGGKRYGLCLHDNWHGHAFAMGRSHVNRERFAAVGGIEEDPSPLQAPPPVWAPPPVSRYVSSSFRYPKDTRSTIICRLAIQMVRAGAADARIKSSLHSHNETFSPPLPADRVNELIMWAREKKEPANVR
jgi:hypothetical protein